MTDQAPDVGYAPGLQDFDGAEHPTTSKLAITSLVCSLFLCCPITTFLGPILGIISIFLIGSNAARKGKGLAIAAIVIGVLATAGWIFAGRWGWSNVYRIVMTGPNAALEAGYAGDYDAFRSDFRGQGADASDAEIKAFIEQLSARYGAFDTAIIDESAQQTPTQQNQEFVDLPYLVKFTDGSNAIAECRIFMVDDNKQLNVKLDFIHFDLDDGQSIVFPPGAKVDDAPGQEESASDGEDSA